MSIELYLAYVLACFVVVIVPGPTVTVIVANSLRYGTHAGLLNIVGTQFGLATLMAIVLIGLASIIETMGYWFDIVRLAGAAYLVWLGWRLIRAPGALAMPAAVPMPDRSRVDPGSATKDAKFGRGRPWGGFVLQGYLVVVSNPKALLMFGAFIPQFVNVTGDYVVQVVLLGVTAMVTAGIFDSGYAVLAGRARSVMSGSRARLISRLSGAFLIGGGIWLALTRAR